LKKISLIVFLFTSVVSFASHNRAGEILYKRIEPFSEVVAGVTVPVFNYFITVVKYTNDGEMVQDRCADTVYFGDGTRGVAYRTNGNSSCGDCAHCGEILSSDDGFIVKLNTYTITHQYPGSGNYLIRSLDPNRNAGVNNIPFSDLQPFYIESLLIINNFTGANSSPVLLNLPTDRACVGKCFSHNPGAYDADGDFLSFEITTSRGANGSPVQGYAYPDSGNGGSYRINATTGELRWCTPQLQGEYNLAFIVREWRKNTSGVYQQIGYILRDMQVLVGVCPNNNPPTIILPSDTCVEAGSFFKKTILINDLGTNPNLVTISASGGAFSSPVPNATLNYATTQVPYPVDFSWQTDCNHIRLQPYQTVFKAKDSGPDIVLASFATYNVRIIPPSIKNVSATPIGSSIKLNWQPSSCNPSQNPLIAYKIYRKNDCTPYTYTPCLAGVDPSSGFELIGQTAATSTSFVDTNNGYGLSVGKNYSYIVVAVYRDGSTSYGSSPVCQRLKRDIPLLLNVDVVSTSTSTGVVYVKWSLPLTTVGNLDTIAFPGPYQLNLKHRASPSGAFSTIYSSSSPYFLNLDTNYTHSPINTVDTDAEYQLEFMARTITIGSSQLASSVFLTAMSADRKITLNWSSNSPWENYNYKVYRKNPSSSTFSIIATTSLTSYEDSDNIVNRNSYCYKILSEGEYSDATIFKPLLNNSQEVCAMAKDLTPPCTPTLSVEANCQSGFIKVEWINVRLSCSDDVLKYALFYKPTPQEMYAIIDTLNNNTTSFTYDGLTLISGCYAVQAIDSSGNSSALSADFCLDNCPEFELPNIFSPNNDGSNDFYKAVKVRQIKEIDLVIFDRWGNLVYKTIDPYFQWDGTSLQSKQLVSEGTFFYICDVFEPRLTGIRKRKLKGYLQMVR
jgi:gliding motility-associated-like protein